MMVRCNRYNSTVGQIPHFPERISSNIITSFVYCCDCVIDYKCLSEAMCCGNFCSWTDSEAATGGIAWLPCHIVLWS